MRRSTFRVAAILVAVFALLTSSCFALRGMNMTKYRLTPGERTAIRFDLKPYSFGSLQTADKVFVLVGWTNADRVSRVQFDVQGNWGGTFYGKNTVSLANELLEPGACQAYGIEAADVEAGFDNWEAWHTRVEIDATGLTAADMSLNLRATVKIERPAGTVNGEEASLVVFTGGWGDGNNNNVFDAGEEVVCTGAAFFSVPYVG
jgi:hypothetical protein